MGKRVKAFFAFLYDFVIGDDWRIAVGVVAGLAVTYAVSQTSVPSWWVMPALLVILLPASLWRATRRR
jgi:phage shock protein PspC (stress-responsive transcriptional regulator)